MTWLSARGATLMAIVNVNADSFSDPRAAVAPTERAERAFAAMREGAAIVDLGAQSAATHLPVVPPEQEIESLTPVVTALVAADVPVSVDTYKPEVAGPMLDLGVDLINDYSGLEHPEVVELVASRPGAQYVLTHNRGRPKQRLTEPARYQDVTDDVISFFTDRLDQVESLGLPSGQVVLDPGVDLSKTPAQTVKVLREVDRITAAFPDHAQLWAISRKDVLGVITGRMPAERDPATLALVAHLADRPRTVLRVHDVAAARDFLAVRDVIVERTELGESDLLDPSLYRETLRETD